MTAPHPPAGPRTQEIPLAPAGATAAGAAEEVQPAPPHPAAPPLPPPPAPGTVTTAVQPRVEDTATHAAAAQPTGPLDSWFGAPSAPPAGPATPPPAPHAGPEDAPQPDPAAPQPPAPQPPAPQPPVSQQPAPQPGATARRAPRRPRDRALLTGAGLVALSLLLLQLGLALDLGGEPLWSVTPLWSAFATLAVLVGALPLATRLPLPGGAATAEKVALGGLTGLGVFWLLVGLPNADTDRGFLLTAALAALGVALWLAPARRR
ncbi:hypothetical protein [Geodermatophilus sp. URMC 63]